MRYIQDVHLMNKKMLRLYHRTPRQLIKLVNLSGDNNFVFFNTSYRHFFVFLSSICSIQRPNLPCLEQNVLTNTFLPPNKLRQRYKLFYRFPTCPRSIFAPIVSLVAFFKMPNRFPSFGSSFAWICARVLLFLRLGIWYLLKKGKVSSFRRKIPRSKL